MRTRPPEPKNIAAPPRVVVASAARRTAAESTDPTNPTRGVQAWQEKGWYYYDNVGEFRAAVNWVANVLSRAKLYVVHDTGAGPEPVEENSDADKVLNEFGGGQVGQRALLHDYGVLYSVPGEAWTVGYEDKDGTQHWDAYSPGDIVANGSSYRIESQNLTLPDTAVVIQSWRPHPRRRQYADSPTRAALPILSEIDALTQHIDAQTSSRLASAGILFVPNEIAATAVGATRDATSQATAEAFVKILSDVASRAIRDRSDPAALVPITVTGDAAFIDKVNYVKFWSNLDEHAIELRTEAIRRLALSLDMPPEILTGTGDVNHWGAWAIDESAIKSHTEPLLGIICTDLTLGYLRPALTGVVDDPENFSIAADTSDMRLRPNRSKEAMELWDRGELSGATLLRETGFEAKADAMKPDERKDWFARKVASGSTTPELVAAALKSLGLDLGEGVPEMIRISENPDKKPTEARPDPSLLDHPVQGPPQEALLAAAEQMVFRALERAGNRLRNKFRTSPGVSASESYLFMPTLSASDVEFALEDGFSQCERFAAKYGVTHTWLEETLRRYCSVLIATKKPYDEALLRTYLGM